MNDAKPVRCQKCGKPIGYITVVSQGLLGMPQQVGNVKIVAVCMECSKNNSARFTVP